MAAPIPKQVEPLRRVMDSIEEEMAISMRGASDFAPIPKHKQHSSGVGFMNDTTSEKPTPEESVAQWIVDMPYTNLKPMCEGIAKVAKQRGKAPDTFLDFVEILHTWALRIDNKQPIEALLPQSSGGSSSVDLVPTNQANPTP